MFEKSDSNTPLHHVRKVGSGRPKQIKGTEVIAEINRTLKIEEVRKQNFSMCYSLLSLRELTSKIYSAGISISHVTVRTMLKAQGFFIYGLSESFKGNPSALELYINHIHLNISHFHRNNNPVVFIDIKKTVDKNPNEISNDSVNLQDLLVEWWNKLGSQKYPKSSEILIFTKGGSLKENKLAFQNFVNEAKVKITFWHIPGRIIKWFNINSENFSKTICVKRKHRNFFCNASIHLILKPLARPNHDLATILSLLVNIPGTRKIEFISPAEWNYSLKPASKT